MILDVLLKHLLAPEYVYVEAAQDLVNHWIASDVRAAEHVLDKLFMVIQAKLDSVTGYSEDKGANDIYESALSCNDIIRQLLSRSLWDEGDRAASRTKERYEEALSLELDTVHACELLDLLTHGKIKLSPPQLRTNEAQENNFNLRLDAVCQVFVSNPSNYKLSMRVKDWLIQHHVGKMKLSKGEMTTELWSEPLTAVMQLARLLRVDSQKSNIWMKGAYAALYCMDYDVAYNLTMQIINEIPAETDLVVDRSDSDDELTLLQLVSLVLDLVSASSFRSWEKKRKLCCALLSTANAPSTDLFAHQATDLVLSWLEKIEAVQALVVELGLSDNDLEQRRLAKGNNTSNVEDVLLNELKVVVDLLHEEKHDRQFLLRLLQRGIQLILAMSNNIASAEDYDNWESVSTYLQQMVQLCMEEATELVATPTASDTGDWRQYMELGFSYLVVLGDLNNYDNNFEAFCIDEILSRVCTEQAKPDSSIARSSELLPTTEAVVRNLHHFFLLQAFHAKDTAENDAGLLLSRRERFDNLSCSYETTRRVVNCANNLHDNTLSDAALIAEKSNNSRLLVPKERYTLFVNLAKRCQERLATQKKSQELERMSTFFNTDLDLERFSQDEGYRSNKSLLLATKKEHIQLSRQFASKYGIDEYECILMYIKSALLFRPDRSRAGRHEQLDQAFAIEQIDILEEALQRPISFGNFLLNRWTTGAPSLYESIDGTDHVGLLLMLRMVLECSKRIDQVSEESVSPQERSLFPLSKASTDRITVLLVCLKKLKDVADSLDEVDSVDLKLIGVASTTTELLTPLATLHTDVTANRQVAVEAARPLLTGKTIKIVTKILRKLHHVTASSMVMIYVNDIMTKIWSEHGVSATSEAKGADLASYAYESCAPCLSVLSNEHLMLFNYLFLDGWNSESLPELVAHINLAEEFYGQQLRGLQRFGALLTLQKRVEVVADTLTTYQSKYDSWQSSGPRSNDSSASSTNSSLSVGWGSTQYKRKEQELHYLERKLAETMCCLLLNEIEQSESTFDKCQAKAKTLHSLKPVAVALRSWFAMDPLQQTTSEKNLHSTILMELCQRVASVDLATLIMELVLLTGGSKLTHKAVADEIVHSYKTTVTNFVNRCLDHEEDEANRFVHWVERLAWMWAMGTSAPSSNQIAGLENYLCAALQISRNEKSVADTIYKRVVMQLMQSPSKLLKEIGSSRITDLQSLAENDASRKNLVGLVREAVLSQWEQLISFKEEQGKWMEAAVLSHVLVSRDTNKGYSNADYALWDFGLHVKAVWSAVLTKHKMNASTEQQRVFEVPSREILNHFAAVFTELLAFIEACSCDNNPNALRFAEMGTVALSNLLVRHGDVRDGLEGPTQRSASAWENEQHFAVQTRAHAQFQVGSAIKRPATFQKEEVPTCWSALFTQGVWGAQLLSWYTSYAYAELSSEEEATETVILAYWKPSSIDVAIQLLMMCPFDDLREKYIDRLWLALRQLAQGSRSWSEAMNLALLRFDVAALVQHGLHSSLVAFLMRDSNRNPARWTSSNAYVVCALVTKGEFAAAGRLTCALHHTHPLLWDVENARLVLANYLKSLASSSLHHNNIYNMDLFRLQHEVYVQTSSHFANTLH